MKKIVALFMVLAMMLSCTALAEVAPIEFGTENTLVYACDVAYTEGTVDALGNPVNKPGVPSGLSHFTSWIGEWVLAAAYISEDCIDEFEIEDIEAGYYAVPENAIFLNLEPNFDGSANDPSGVNLVSLTGSYWHAHAYDLKGTLVFPEEIDEDGYTVTSIWENWVVNVRGEADGDFNFGPTKVSLNGDDDYLYWNDVTSMGLDEDLVEEFEEFKFLGMNADGQIVLIACDGNIVNRPAKAVIYLAYIFNPVVAE